MQINISIYEISMIKQVLNQIESMSYKEFTPEAVGKLQARAFIAALPLNRILNKQITLEINNDA